MASRSTSASAAPSSRHMTRNGVDVIDVKRHSSGVAGAAAPTSSYIHVGPFPPRSSPHHRNNNINNNQSDNPSGLHLQRHSNPLPHSSQQNCATPPQPLPLTSYPWYVAEMSRDEAEDTMKNSADGTFMIRRNKGNHALSIAYAGSVKHIRVKKVCLIFGF